MEEKKLKKEVAGKQQKLSYEELNKVCAELYQQVQKYQKQLYEMNLTNMYTRLNYLFKVLEHASVIKDAEFINSCVEEIKDAMIIRNTEEEGKE